MLSRADAIVNTLAVSPDGGTVATGTDDGQVLLTATTGAPDGVSLPVPDGAVYGLTYRPDGDLLAVGGSTGEVTLWDVGSPAAPHQVDLADASVGTTIYGLAFSADGSVLAAAVADGTVRVWLAGADGRFTAVATIPAFEGTAQAVAFDAGGTIVATAGSEGLVALWDVSVPAVPVQIGATFTAAGGQIGSLDLSPDGSTIAAGSADTLVHLWDISDPTAPVVGLELTGPTSWVNDVAFSTDGTRLAAASSDKRLWVWDATTGATVQSLPHPATLIAADWSRDGTELYSAGADGALRVWEHPGSTLSGFASIPGQGAFGGDLVATASRDGIRIWNGTDLDDLSLVSLTPAPADARLDGSVDISPELSLVVAGDTTGGIHFWDVADPAHPRFLTSVAAHSDWVDAVTFDASGTRLAVASDDASITLWDLSDGVPAEPTSRLPDLGGFAYTAFFSPDGTTLVASVLAGQVLLADVSDLAHPRLLGEPLTGPEGYVYAAAFSPDGTTIAASGNDKTVWLWDVTDPAAPHVLGSPLLWADGYATNVIFGAGGRLLAAAMTDGTVRLWDLTDRSAPVRFASLEGITGTVYGVEFSADGSHLSAAGADRTIRIWNTSLDQAGTEVCAAAARGLGLSAAEWARVAGDVPLPAFCPR